MGNTDRVDKALIEGGHYLGKPADANDLLVRRRIGLVRQMVDFLGKDKTLVEIGCGNGNTCLPLAADFASVRVRASVISAERDSSISARR